MSKREREEEVIVIDLTEDKKQKKEVCNYSKRGVIDPLGEMDSTQGQKASTEKAKKEALDVAKVAAGYAMYHCFYGIDKMMKAYVAKKEALQMAKYAVAYAQFRVNWLDI